MYCSNCGNECVDNDLFCGRCGTALNQVAPVFSASPVTSSNVPTNYNIVQRGQFNFGVLGLISSIAIFPVTLMVRMLGEKTVTAYGWREYTKTILPDNIKVVAVILIMALLATSITCACVGMARKQKNKNVFFTLSLLISIIATIGSFVLIFSEIY